MTEGSPDGKLALDSIAPLALAVRSGHGVYAVLLGSGVSRAAKIMTGWEVTLDLIRKLAALEGDEEIESPEEWYRKKFEQEPDYSTLLGKLSHTQADRGQLLKGYFEPSSEHRARGERVPTAAHHAIASLVARGYVRVIITTNFDRLMEDALVAQSIQPQVVSTADQIAGMSPLAHSKCTVIKVNGDYLDQRIRNTPDELREYEPELDGLLNEVFDVHGLIVCGWSAEYDSALRAAIERAPNRRFSTYWISVGELTDPAMRLIELRGGGVIKAAGADPFFTTLGRMIESLEVIDSHHPLTLPLVVTQLKRAIESRERITKYDLLSEVTDNALGTFRRSPFDRAIVGVTAAALLSRITAYESVLQPLVGIMVTGAAWEEDGDFEEYSRVVLRVLGLAGFAVDSDPSESLTRYPALFLVYAAGVVCVARGKYKSLAQLLRQIYRRPLTSDPIPLTKAINAISIINQETGRLLPDMARRHTPASDWLLERLRPYTREYFIDEVEYADAFSQFEYLLALVYADTIGKGTTGWVPIGRYHWYGVDENDGGPIGRLHARMNAGKEFWPPYMSGLFSAQYIDFVKLVGRTEAFRSKIAMF